MFPDVVHLKQFYATRLGEHVERLVFKALLAMWPDASDDAMLVIGYGAPYADAYLKTAAPLIVCMQAEQGAAAWPAGAANRVAMAHDSELPFQNNSMNRVLLIHSVEHSEQLNAMMQEVWRVLTPGGRVLAVVPNRVSMWAGAAETPFGFGRPFNVIQLRALFTNHQFTISNVSSALFTPPFIAKLSRRVSQKIEAIGRVCWWFMGGVLLVEAEKQLYASLKESVVRPRKTFRLPHGLLQPEGAKSSKSNTSPSNHKVESN